MSVEPTNPEMNSPKLWTHPDWTQPGQTKKFIKSVLLTGALGFQSFFYTLEHKPHKNNITHTHQARHQDPSDWGQLKIARWEF